MSVKVAAAKYQVPRTTLGDRAKGRTKAMLGRPTQLTEEEERILAKRAILLGTWGFPLNFRDFRELVKSYLDAAGRTTMFKDNFPTKKFVIDFLARHKELSFMKANNIKRSRALVSREEVQEFSSISVRWWKGSRRGTFGTLTRQTLKMTLAVRGPLQKRHKICREGPEHHEVSCVCDVLWLWPRGHYAPLHCLQSFEHV
jgi:hypothetical protein